MQNIIEALQWRYATKRFDPEKKLTERELVLVKDTLRLAPSSYGLQPYQFIIVTNDDVRVALRKAAYDQPQITDASHLIIFAARTNVDHTFVDAYVERIAHMRGVDKESLQGVARMIRGVVDTMSPVLREDWATRQAYLAAGVLIAAVASEGIDACPMEGFDTGAFDRILGLAERGLAAKVVVALGYRAVDDAYAGAPKVRLSNDNLFIEVK